MTINATALVEVRDLDFYYRDRKALSDVSFDIPVGSVTALVGANGAGKTTLLRCLAALDEPQAGRITIDGVNVSDAPRAAHMKLGFLQDFFGVYDQLTVRQNLLHAAAAMSVPRSRIPEAADSALNAVGLASHIDHKAQELSRGLRQRLAIARTIIHNPRLLLFDEPAAGLDPDARRELSQLIRSLQQRGATIVVSSHILSELQDYSTHMLAVRDGRVEPLIAIGAQRPQGQRLSLRLLGEAGQAIDILHSYDTVSDIRQSGADIFFNHAGDEAAQAALVRDLVLRDVAVLEVKIASENLEQLYFG